MREPVTTIPAAGAAAPSVFTSLLGAGSATGWALPTAFVSCAYAGTCSARASANAETPNLLKP